MRRMIYTLSAVPHANERPLVARIELKLEGAIENDKLIDHEFRDWLAKVYPDLETVVKVLDE